MLGAHTLQCRIDSTKVEAFTSLLTKERFKILQNFKDTSSAEAQAKRLAWLWSTHRYPTLRASFESEIPKGEEETFEHWTNKFSAQLKSSKKKSGASTTNQTTHTKRADRENNHIHFTDDDDV
jgi:hypothetical protein